ncbi:MAG TPA: SpoIIE family protein phosphatase [Bryobacteraceae bacterium]|jgi:serine phosphatase RsbU (regulator of sigma subunit)/pSer/pThr/pTyr-binding forkhead associated (FHA) protein|nr:SpoIIE family protein phosphatase [Bryobacteraceae bacterium]
MELLISGPEGSSTTVPLEADALSLGRSAENDLAYPEDPWLSRSHLRFERQKDQWFVKDCASRNGTIVNATSLKEAHRLRPGDRIYAGHLVIEIRETGTAGSGTGTAQTAAPVSKSGATANRLVSFVPQNDQFLREATVVTNLEKVLGQTTSQARYSRDSTLSTVRVVRALIRAGQELAGHRPLEEVFRVILDLSLAAVEAMRGVILTLEDGELVLRASKGEGFTISTSVRDRVLSEKCSLMISDAQVDAAFREQRSIVTQRVRSIMAVPLQTGDRVIGLIYVDTGALIRPFTQEDLDLLTVMANVAAIRIEHARLALVEQSEKLMESEFNQASDIQRSLLPTEIPQCPGYELAGSNIPCRTVGGDYYDFLPYSDGHLGLVVGDVSGKGLPAALMMSSLQARVHMMVETSPEPAAAIEALNRNIAPRCPMGKFITLFYGLLEPSTGQMLYANAGHNYPLLIRADGAVEQLRGNGMVLGILPNSQYQAYQVDLEPGDVLVLFSDGVTEAREPIDGEEFGDERLAHFLLSHKDRPAAEMIESLVSKVRDWSGQMAFADDFTILLVKRQAQAQGFGW